MGEAISLLGGDDDPWPWPYFGETLVLLCRLGIVYVYCSHYIYLLALRRLYLWPLVYAFIP